MKKKRMGEILVEAGVITPAELLAGLELQARIVEEGVAPKRLGEILLELGVIDEDRLAWCLAEMTSLPVLSLTSVFIDPKVLRLLPRERCRQLCVLPVSLLDGSLTLAMADPLDVTAFDLVRAITRMPLRPTVATASSINANIKKYYREDVGLEEVVARLFPPEDLDLAADNDLGITAGDDRPGAAEEEYFREGDSTPVIRLVNSVIRDAIRMRASDIHVEPTETSSLVRYRIDGLLRNVVSLPLFLHPRNVCRIKIMGRMDIAEHRIPQDGSCRVRHRHNEYDLRLSTMPTQFGEKVVIRILNRQEAQIRLEGAGLLPDAFAQLEKILQLPQGMVLVTGPTGSGKTTTLYAMLHRLKGESRNIVTLEDPIEYNLPGIMQTQTHEKAGLSFSAGFRALLRQDPDVIMVGEIRDNQTAGIAFNASVTGHMVLSTLHTNDSASAPVRLAELGVSSFLISTGLKAVVAQRLVRRLCTQCRIAYEPDADVCRLLGLNPNEPVTLYKAGGCKVCSQSGYYRRVGIFEVLSPSDRIKELIFNGSSGAQLYEQAVREGMRDLMEDAALRVIQGVTSLEEVMRVVPLQERKGVCPQCQRAVERYYQSCPFCSFPLWKNLCRTCGKELESEWKFCPYCAGGSSPGQAGRSQATEAQARPRNSTRAREVARCSSCGMVLRPSWNECPLCLTPVREQVEPPVSPVSQPAPAAAGSDQSLSGAPEPPGEGQVRPSLLVVTDDPETLMQVRRVAREAGFAVSQAGGCEEAMRRTSISPPDGVVLEGVTGSEGRRSLEKLRASLADREIPMAVLTRAPGDSPPVPAGTRALRVPVAVGELQATFRAGRNGGAS